MNEDIILYLTLGILLGVMATVGVARFVYQMLTPRDTDFLDAPRPHAESEHMVGRWP